MLGITFRNLTKILLLYCISKDRSHPADSLIGAQPLQVCHGDVGLPLWLEQ